VVGCILWLFHFLRRQGGEVSYQTISTFLQWMGWLLGGLGGIVYYKESVLRGFQASEVQKRIDISTRTPRNGL